MLDEPGGVGGRVVYLLSNGYHVQSDAAFPL